MPNVSIEEQIKTVWRLLKGREFDRSTESGKRYFEAAMGWLSNFPTYVPTALKVQLQEEICRCFSLREIDLINYLDGAPLEISSGNGHHPVSVLFTDQDKVLEEVLPKEGWFANYAEYTRYNESPMSYHIFSSLAVLGAALGRRVWMPMGFFSIYPNYNCILIGPTGIKKTHATDIGKDLIKEANLCPIMADAITPESLASCLVKSGHHFIYAPEMAVFLGKQRYNDSLATRLLRLLDCPQEWKVQTQSRGEEIVTDIAITMLSASTLSLISESSAAEVASSGFLNRFVLVVEKDSERCFPVPMQGEGHAKLLKDVLRVKQMVGEMKWSPLGRQCYEEWYRRRKHFLRKEADELTSEVLQRSFNHVLRTAMLMHLVLHDDFQLCDVCMQHAIKLIEYTDRQIPQTVHALRHNTISVDLDYVVDHILKAGGAIDHSTLLRKVANRMSTADLKKHIRTLEESGRLRISKKGAAKHYFMQLEAYANASN